MESDTWMDIKILWAGNKGEIEVFLNNKKVISWNDPNKVIQAGQYISLRTGSSGLQLDHLQVFKLSTRENLGITVGKGDSNMVRQKSQGNNPAVRIYLSQMKSLEEWGEILMDEAIIR